MKLINKWLEIISWERCKPKILVFLHEFRDVIKYSWRFGNNFWSPHLYVTFVTIHYNHAHVVAEEEEVGNSNVVSSEESITFFTPLNKLCVYFLVEFVEAC